MISWVDCLLCRWGRWAVKKELDGIGYVSQSKILKGWAARGDGYGSSSPMGFCADDVMACDRAISELPAVLRIVVVEHYQRQSSVRDTAKRCGISPKSVTQYISQAHGAIARHLEVVPG